MKVSKLEIMNFRGVSSGELLLPDHPILIGANNAGKTTVFEALALLLGRDRLVRDLTENDFYGTAPEPGSRIRLVATLTGFATNEPDDHPDWFRDGRGIPFWFNSDDGSVSPDRVGAADSMLCVQLAFQAFFDRESLSVETVRYFFDGDYDFDPFDEQPCLLPGTLLGEVGFFLARATRTWDRTLSWNSELFKRTLNVAGGQPFQTILDERDRLRAPDAPVEQDAQIEGLVQGVNAELAKYILNSPQLAFRVTNTDSKSLLEAIAAHFTSGEHTVPANRQGSGLVSLQILLLLLELGKVRLEQGHGFILALEEPELHLAPNSQLQLVRRLHALSTQVLTTTHSPSVCMLADPTSLLYLKNGSGQLECIPLLRSPLDDEAPNWKRKLIQQDREPLIAALLCEAVLIPEGASDFWLFRIIRDAINSRQGWDDSVGANFALSVGLIPTNDAKVVEYQEFLTPFGKTVICVVDGDIDGDNYARRLQELDVPPQSIVQWPEGWAIEETVSWIAQPCLPITLEIADGDIVFENTDGLSRHLRDKKMDIVLYESIAASIAGNDEAIARATRLFGGIAEILSGRGSDIFITDGIHHRLNL